MMWGVFHCLRSFSSLLFSKTAISTKWKSNTAKIRGLVSSYKPHSNDTVNCANNLQQGAEITLHIILLGEGGTIYTAHALNQFKKLGIDLQRSNKLARLNHLSRHIGSKSCKVPSPE
eukprot:1155246-Pelagomonas_calceolata.AAC.1